MICSATRVNGEPCKAQAVTNGSTCSFHASDKLGCQEKLTPEVADKLVALLKAGNYVSIAARAAGISKTIFYRWLDRGASDAEEDADYRELRERVELARAEAEARNVAAIASAARDSWQAAAWLLERQYPDRWGRVSVRLREELSDETSKPDAVAVDDPFAEVDQLAERRAQRR